MSVPSKARALRAARAGSRAISFFSGIDWGENGCGWLPYVYIERELADDFWTLVDAGFVNSSLFE